jgi:hypothetical protein
MRLRNTEQDREQRILKFLEEMKEHVFSFVGDDGWDPMEEETLSRTYSAVDQEES